MKPKPREQGWEVVFRASDEWQAEMVSRLLIGEGIPAIVQSLMVPGYANVMSAQVGYWGEVLCPRACRSAAHVLLKDLENGADEEDDQKAGR
ncbi:MAG TPA: hypothetical protein PKK84_07010 [Armatimonadota bacterium]|nr:hypothetical protein [Armatimonadota bacterium]